MDGPISKDVSSALPRVFFRPTILISGEGPGDEVAVYELEYGRHVARRRRRRRWAHALAIHAASHVDHKKRVAWFSISKHACGSVPIVMGLCLATLHTARAPL